MTYADNEFLTTSEGIYSANPLDTVKCYYDIKEAKESHHYVIVIVHGGNEFYNLPSPRTKKLFRYIVDVGADVVLSHHTHVFFPGMSNIMGNLFFMAWEILFMIGPVK